MLILAAGFCFVVTVILLAMLGTGLARWTGDVFMQYLQTFTVIFTFFMIFIFILAFFTSATQVRSLRIQMDRLDYDVILCCMVSLHARSHWTDLSRVTFAVETLHVFAFPCHCCTCYFCPVIVLLSECMLLMWSLSTLNSVPVQYTE